MTIFIKSTYIGTYFHLSGRTTNSLNRDSTVHTVIFFLIKTVFHNFTIKIKANLIALCSLRAGIDLRGEHRTISTSYIVIVAKVSFGPGVLIRRGFQDDQ